MFIPRTPYTQSCTYTALARSLKNRSQYGHPTQRGGIHQKAQQRIAELRQKTGELRRSARVSNPSEVYVTSEVHPYYIVYEIPMTSYESEKSDFQPQKNRRQPLTERHQHHNKCDRHHHDPFYPDPSEVQVKDPNVIPYNLRLRKLAKDRNWREALNCIREIHESGLTPDEISYATAIDACSKALKSKQAIQLFQEMKNDGIRPNVPIYNAVMNACARDHQWRKSLNFLNDMQKQGVDPNIVSYNVCLSALEKSKKWNLAFDLMKQMRLSGIPMQAITYNTVISACAKSRKMNVCEEVLGMMRKDGFKPDAFTYSSLLNGYRKTRNWTSLFRAFDNMRTEGVVLDAVIYSTVIGAYADAGRSSDAFSLFNEMKQQNIRANEIVYSCVLRACNSVEQVDHLLREMEVNGVKKNSVVFTSAINVCHKVKGGVKDAVRWFDQMLSQGIKPDWVAYMSLFEVLNNNKCYDLLDHYYLTGLQNGVLSHYSKDSDFNEKTIDLHGWSTALARAALRNVMQEYCQDHRTNQKLVPLRILTGKGYSKNQPVLRPAVTKMLMADFQPGLQHEISQTGDIFISPESIRAYVAHQQNMVSRKALDLALDFERLSLEEERRLQRQERMEKLALEMESYTNNIANIDADIANLERALFIRSDSPPPAYFQREERLLSDTFNPLDEESRRMELAPAGTYSSFMSSPSRASASTSYSTSRRASPNAKPRNGSPGAIVFGLDDLYYERRESRV